MRMNFVLTNYIQPLEQKIPLSKTLNVYLDNPRTEEEINHLTKYIGCSIDPNRYQYEGEFGPWIATSRKDAGDIPDNMWVANLEDFLISYQKHVNDDFTQNFFKKEHDNITNNPTNIVAKMFVILRYEEGEIEDSEKETDIEIKAGVKKLTILFDDHPTVQNSNNAISITYLLSLLAFRTPGESAGSFILHNGMSELQFFKFDRSLNNAIFTNIIYYFHRNQNDSIAPYYDFNLAISKLESWINKLDSHFKKFNTPDELDKILFISTALKNSNELEEKSNLLSIVSLLELLLTHDPVYNRSKSDSIKKQFVSKISHILQKQDPNVDLVNLKKKISIIYKQRSNIAHGNFAELNKYIESLKKDDDFFENEEFYDLCIAALSFLKATLQKYFNDKLYVDRLKKK